jgi:hypothetical protein
MNQQLQTILNVIEQSATLSVDEKNNIEKTAKEVDAELAKKNRELVIESSLEKVRARAMAMQKSEELSETAFILYQQFKELGGNPVQITIGIVNENENVLELWLTKEGNQIDRLFKVSIDEPIVIHKIYAAWKEQKKSLIIEISGQELKEYNEYRNSLSNIRFNNDSDEDRRIISIAFFSKGVLSISHPEPAQPEIIELLERFAAVFEGTYTRFLDLKKAEAQAREAQIEAALEKVRSRSLAMHKSDELKEAGELLWNELSKLGIESLSSGYVLIDQEEKIGWIYAPSPASGKIENALGVFHTETKEMQQVLLCWKKQEPMSVVEMNEQETIAHQTFIAEKSLLENGNIAQWITAEQLIALSPKKLYLHNFNFKQGYLMIVGGNRLNEKEIELMLRFTKVFQQTYTRFLDLQKAEAQAREAQIEAALERVRSRSMGMQKSEELKEVIQIVYEQFIHLNINVGHAGFVVDYKPKSDWHFWIADKNDIPSKITHPYFESVWANQFDEAKEKGIDLFTTNLNFEEKNKFYNKLLSYVPGLPEESKIFYLSCPGLAASTALSDNVSLYIENFSGIPYSDEENKILLRFGKVFQQTYTRFLDLQKAEAQAREGRIQLALERVRARTMAMQHSQELLEVIRVVSQQLQQLDFRFNHVSFGINNQAQDYHFWTAMANTLEPQELNVPYIDNPVFEHIRKAQRQQLSFFSDILTPEENDQWTLHMLKFVGEDFLSEDAKSYIKNKSIARSVVITPNIFLITVKYKPIPYSEEENDILKRFGQVFDQSYTRFLDLQKAEAQAREAQIETALERVRSRTAAMQKSQELEEVIQLISEQMIHLGIEMSSAGFMLDYRKTNDINNLVFSPSLQKGIQLSAPYFDHPICKLFVEAKQKSLDFYPARLNKEEKDIMLAHVFAYNPVFPEEVKEMLYNAPGYADSHALMKNVGLYIQNYTGIPYSDADNAILMRFGKAFEQTYTRFIDLQKAEAQVREAQIEAALERVRSRTTAMQKSEELNEIIRLVCEQMLHLGIQMNSAGFMIDYKESNDFNTLVFSKIAERVTEFHIPYFDHIIFRKFIEAKEKAWIFTMLY